MHAFGTLQWQSIEQRQDALQVVPVLLVLVLRHHRVCKVLQVLCLPDVRVAKEHRAAANELATLVNEQLWLGHFDIWSNGGVLLYRNGTLLADNGMLSLAQAQALIEIAVDECDRFYPAFQFVLWGGKSPRDALEAAMVDAAGEA